MGGDCGGREKRWIGGAQKVFGIVRILYKDDTMKIHYNGGIIHLSKPAEYTTPGMKPKVNSELLTRMCQRRFIHYDKCLTLVEAVNNGGGCTHVKAGNIYKISIPSSQFCCESK